MATSQPFPFNFFGVVQSETEIAVLNTTGSMGKKMVVGYNDSFGFDDNRQGLSGYAYSTNGGNTWIDGGGWAWERPQLQQPVTHVLQCRDDCSNTLKDNQRAPAARYGLGARPFRVIEPA